MQDILATTSVWYIINFYLKHYVSPSRNDGPCHCTHSHTCPERGCLYFKTWPDICEVKWSSIINSPRIFPNRVVESITVAIKFVNRASDKIDWFDRLTFPLTLTQWRLSSCYHHHKLAISKWRRRLSTVYIWGPTMIRGLSFMAKVCAPAFWRWLDSVGKVIFTCPNVLQGWHWANAII